MITNVILTIIAVILIALLGILSEATTALKVIGGALLVQTGMAGKLDDKKKEGEKVDKS